MNLQIHDGEIPSTTRIAKTCLIDAAMPRHAPEVTWQFQDVTFTDGGTASGSFVYDAMTNAFSAVSLSTTDGSVRTGIGYSLPTLVGNPLAADFTSAFAAGATRFLLLGESPMTDAGGTIAPILLVEFTCITAGCTEYTDPAAFARDGSGSITTQVPEPTSVALLGLGLAGLAFTRRKRQQSCVLD